MLGGCSETTGGLKSVNQDIIEDAELPVPENTEETSQNEITTDKPQPNEKPDNKSEDKDKTDDNRRSDNPPANNTVTSPKSPLQPLPDNAVTETQNIPIAGIDPEQVNAKACDAADIADKVIQYINEYRQKSGITPLLKLSGLTGFSEYRSRQIISNFSHDISDRRAAAAALKYGEYINPKDFNIDTEPYYEVAAREAISKHGQVGTVDKIAKETADLFKNSSSHWSYLGDAKYIYVGVGVTYYGGMWYCTVSVSETDIG